MFQPGRVRPQLGCVALAQTPHREEEMGCFPCASFKASPQMRCQWIKEELSVSPTTFYSFIALCPMPNAQCSAWLLHLWVPSPAGWNSGG